MSIKIAMKNFFNDLLEYWADKYGTLPKAPWDEEADPLLYQSEPDEEEYVYWKPLEKTFLEDFKEIEEMLSFQLHLSIKEYFTSFWFLSLQGFKESNLVNLEPVEPGKDIKEYFINLKNYEESQGRDLRYIQIGFISPEDSSLLVDNQTGKLIKENFETGEYEIFSESLENLIEDLKVTQ